MGQRNRAPKSVRLDKSIEVLKAKKVAIDREIAQLERQKRLGRPSA